MTKKTSILTLFLFFLSLSLSAKSARAIGSKTITIFQNENIRFDTDSFPTNYVVKNNITYITNGRIAIAKIKLPNYKRNTKAEIEVTLTSNGDPWDKSGSVFILPNHSSINMLTIAKGENQYPKVDSLKYEKLIGTVAAKNYSPTLELMRFMTPFGVGHFSNDSNKLRMPVYIDGWAKEVKWKSDISQLMPILHGEVYIGVFVDTWTKAGYNISAKLHFTESKIRQDMMPKRGVMPLFNSVAYMGQSLPDIFSRKDVEIPFTIPKKAKNVELKYIVTGHGGHSGGDEFVEKENIISVDSDVVYRFTPWRNDCASFRRFNPTSGTWLVKKKTAYITDEGKRGEKEIEEPISSSDLSRSNWCPGSYVPPVSIPLHDIKAGSHILKISIPKAQQAEGNKLNHWLVSAYLVWEI